MWFNLEGFWLEFLNDNDLVCVDFERFFFIIFFCVFEYIKLFSLLFKFVKFLVDFVDKFVIFGLGEFWLRRNVFLFRKIFLVVVLEEKLVLKGDDFDGCVGKLLFDGNCVWLVGLVWDYINFLLF